MGYLLRSSGGLLRDRGEGGSLLHLRRLPGVQGPAPVRHVGRHPHQPPRLGRPQGQDREARVRNSLLMAPMPTASTAQILGNNESVEAYTSNIYTRRVLSGEFQIVNQHLLKDLVELGIWSD